MPIDFSDASKRIVEYALNEQKHKDDHLLLLHSYRLIADGFSSYYDSPHALKKMLEKQLSESYEQFNRDLISPLNRAEIEFRMEVGFMVNSIHTICQESKIDLILYALKCNKQHQMLAELISLDCPPVMLIPETIDIDAGASLNIIEISKRAFSDNWEQCIHELETNSKISYTLMP